MDSIDERVGARIRARRLQLRLTQEEVSRGLGVSFQQLQKYEKGSNRISASRMYQISRILGVKPDHFFDPRAVASDTKPTDFDITAFEDDDARRLNQAFFKIASKDMRRSIIDLIETIARDCCG